MTAGFGRVISGQQVTFTTTASNAGSNLSFQWEINDLDAGAYVYMIKGSDYKGKTVVKGHIMLIR